MKIWRSTDLSNWAEIGYIWKWDKNATWHTKRKKDDPKGREFLWAPEIAYINGTYWVCISHSITPRVTSLIKSSTGKPEGPYIDPVGGPISDNIDGFLFQDDDDQVYYIWGAGQMAKMKPDMSGFANTPITILAGGWEKMGYEVCVLIKHKDKYILTASDHTSDHNGTYDLMYAIADKVEGPYSERRFAAGHAGHATLFHGADGKLYATVFGSDSHSPMHNQLGIIEIDFDDDFNFIIRDTKIGY